MASSSEAGDRVSSKLRRRTYLDVRSVTTLLICHSSKDQTEIGVVRTLSMCSNVVLPALSRPRNSNLACLLRRPKEASTSQNHLDHGKHLTAQDARECWKGVGCTGR